MNILAGLKDFKLQRREMISYTSCIWGTSLLINQKTKTLSPPLRHYEETTDTFVNDNDSICSRFWESKTQRTYRVPRCLKMPTPISCYMHKVTHRDVWCLESDVEPLGQNQWSPCLGHTNCLQGEPNIEFFCIILALQQEYLKFKPWLVLQPFIYSFRLSDTMCINLYTVHTWDRWVASPADLDPCLMQQVMQWTAVHEPNTASLRA